MSAAIGLDRRGEILRAWRNADVEQSEAVDRPAVERAVSDQARRQLAPDHSRSAGDKDVHCDNRRYSAMPPSTRWAWPVM